jgi:homoprotocatechuate degradation regulator HpaR
MKESKSQYRRTRRSLPISLLRAREHVMGPIREMLLKSGVSEQKWRVLRVLEEDGPSEQSIVAAKACLLLPSLTRMLHAMERDGQITRAPDARDGRKSIVSITAAGQAILVQHADESAEIFAQLEKRFGAERMTDLLDLLEDLIATDRT